MLKFYGSKITGLLVKILSMTHLEYYCLPHYKNDRAPLPSPPNRIFSWDMWFGESSPDKKTGVDVAEVEMLRVSTGD